MSGDDIESVDEAPAGDTAPSSEPASDSAEELTSEIRRSIDIQRERGPDGKFVKAEGKPSEKPGRDESRGAARGIATGASANDQTPGGQAEGGKPEAGVRPPQGFSIATKQAWDALPEHVKADIAKREAEVSSGFQRYGGLSKFAEEAERNGTTIQNAVSDYVSVETELRKDPVGGVEFMFRKMGIHPLNVLKAWLSRYVPQQGGNGQAQQTAPHVGSGAQQYNIDPDAIVARATQAVRSEFQMREINNDIAAFSANPANRFFENVRPSMAHLVAADGSLTLQTAYEAACWIHPKIRAILIEEAKGGQDKAATRTATRAQNAAKAVTGAPSNSHAGEPPKRRDLSLDEEIREAVKRQRSAS